VQVQHFSFLFLFLFFIQLKDFIQIVDDKIFHSSNQGKLMDKHGLSDCVGMLVSKQPTCEHTSNDLTPKKYKIHFNSFSISISIFILNFFEISYLFSYNIGLINNLHVESLEKRIMCV
jgi:hypothetical protein